MADATIWIQLVTPVIAACATWATTKFELLSLRRTKQFEGPWFAYYRDPDTREIQEEIWTFSPLGGVTVSRGGKTTFKGRLSLKGNKAYMNVDSAPSRDERLLVMLDPPNNPRSGDALPSVCIWLGKNKDHKTTAGHGLLSRNQVKDPAIKSEFLHASS